ncbi:MAG: RNA methyltransferase [Symploca sp. SIO2E6]|nr:RNA methyltransferase [Symploca sp. SIO2E6]
MLVNPQCEPLDIEAQHMAVHGVDILETAQLVATIPAALTGCQRAIATTARPRALPTPLESPRSALPWLLEAGVNSAVIFGPECRGLSNVELNYAQRFVGIPANPAYPSLNLAQAVAVCCYELYQIAQEQSSKPQDAISSLDGAPIEVLEGYYQHLEALLLQIGYVYPHTAPARLEKLRRLFNRAQPTTAEVSMLRGILRQMQWALQCLPKSVDDGSEPE